MKPRKEDRPSRPCEVIELKDKKAVAMADVYKIAEGGFQPDPWVTVGDDDQLPADAPAFVSVSRWISERKTLIGRDDPVGIHVAAGENVEDLVGDLSEIPAFALEFPAFTDGRSYSVARLLRERHGFKGEIRATGDVLIDQIPLMLRCGFDAFDVAHKPTRAALEAGDLPDVGVYMQPTSDTGEEKVGPRPWLRQRAS